MVILSKARKPNNFESENSLKLSFTNIQGLNVNFVGWVSFLESNYPDILFSTEGGFPLIQDDSVTHMHGLAVCVKEGLPFARNLSLENSRDSYLAFDWLYFIRYLISLTSIDRLLHLCAWLLMFLHLT